MGHVAMGTWLSAVASLALASCADPGPTTTAHDGMWSGHIVAPANCARANYWKGTLAIHEGKILGGEVISGDEGAQFVLGTVYENGTVRAYKTIGPHLWGWGTRPIDIEFAGNAFTMRGQSRCSFHTVWSGTRTGPVPWWVQRQVDSL